MTYTDPALIIPTRYQGRCEFRGCPIDTRVAYQRVSGWARPREQGGTNAIALMEKEPRYACRSCVEREARGYGDQKSML